MWFASKEFPSVARSRAFQITQVNRFVTRNSFHIIFSLENLAANVSMSTVLLIPCIPCANQFGFKVSKCYYIRMVDWQQNHLSKIWLTSSMCTAVNRSFLLHKVKAMSKVVDDVVNMLKILASLDLRISFFFLGILMKQ